MNLEGVDLMAKLYLLLGFLSQSVYREQLLSVLALSELYICECALNENVPIGSFVSILDSQVWKCFGGLLDKVCHCGWA